MSNTNLIIIGIISILFICAVLYFVAKGKKNVVIEEDYATFEDILDGIKTYVVDLTKDGYDDE